MKIAILGYARDGKAAYEYWNRDGNKVTICDEDEQAPVPTSATTKLGKDYLKGLGQFDIIVRTAGLRPSLIVDANPDAPNILDKVTGNISEFMRVCPTKNIIGVTGTKGKGTTCTLITKMLEASGKRAHLGGNIGTPALELLKEKIGADDWVVLEQSSFQLIDQHYSPHIAVCLMVAPEHLNWHPDLEEYTTAKQQLFARQTADDTAIYYADNPVSKSIAAVSPGNKIPYMKPPGAYVEASQILIDGQNICAVSELKLLGEHNWQNVCAAITAVWQITKDRNAIRSVLTTFTGLEHRLELVREVGGVAYYDDSFGTTPETAIVAIKAFKQPKIVILGGSDKGSRYNELAQTVKDSSVRHAILIGDMASKIEAALYKVGFTQITKGHNTMEGIVTAARQQAQAGDVVLLSTGCASFGLFKDYKDRGEQFKNVVNQLA